MLGHTTPAVMRIREALEAAGHEPVIFHANGVGGPAMENLVAAGAIAGVIDYTLSELANAVLDGLHTPPRERPAAGAHGVPQVVVLGCADFFNQGARETVPERFRGRRYFHNPVATLVRLEPDEMAALGRTVAERLNEARGPVRVVAPTQGFSSPTSRAATSGTRRRTPPSSTSSARGCGRRSRSSSSTPTSTTPRSPTSSPSATSRSCRRRRRAEPCPPTSAGRGSSSASSATAARPWRSSRATTVSRRSPSTATSSASPPTA